MSTDAVNNEVQRLLDFLLGQAPPPGAASATPFGGASSHGTLSPNGSGGFYMLLIHYTQVPPGS
jgi:hypothetical protein